MRGRYGVCFAICRGLPGARSREGGQKKRGRRKQRLPPLELSRHEAGVSCFQNYGLVVTVRHRSLAPAAGWQLPSVELTTTATLAVISANAVSVASVMVSV